MQQIRHEPVFTLEEYMRLEEASEAKHEFLGGNIYQMAGGSPEHNQIIINVDRAIGREIPSSCASYSSDQLIWIPACDLATYPDLSYTCERPRYKRADKGRLLINPTLIVEVLSPSTQAWDRNGKWKSYQTIESLQGYLMVSQKRPVLEHYRRDGSEWIYTILEGGETIGGSFLVPSLGVTLDLAEVYRIQEGDEE